MYIPGETLIFDLYGTFNSGLFLFRKVFNNVDPRVHIFMHRNAEKVEFFNTLSFTFHETDDELLTKIDRNKTEKHPTSYVEDLNVDVVGPLVKFYTDTNKKNNDNINNNNKNNNNNNYNSSYKNNKNNNKESSSSSRNNNISNRSKTILEFRGPIITYTIDEANVYHNAVDLFINTVNCSQVSELVQIIASTSSEIKTTKKEEKKVETLQNSQLLLQTSTTTEDLIAPIKQAIVTKIGREILLKIFPRRDQVHTLVNEFVHKHLYQLMSQKFPSWSLEATSKLGFELEPFHNKQINILCIDRLLNKNNNNNNNNNNNVNNINNVNDNNNNNNNNNNTNNANNINNNNNNVIM
jgi:hypothetical protein